MPYTFNINLRNLQIKCSITSYSNLNIQASKFDDNLLNCELTFDFGFSKTIIKPSLTTFDFESLLKQVNKNELNFSDVDKTFKIHLHNSKLLVQVNNNNLNQEYNDFDVYFDNLELKQEIENVLVCLPVR